MGARPEQALRRGRPDRVQDSAGCLAHVEDAHADSFVVLITNVDDILYKETGGRNRILTERLVRSCCSARRLRSLIVLAYLIQSSTTSS